MRATKQLKRKAPPPPPLTAEELALRAEQQARRARAEEVRARLAPMPAQGGQDPQWEDLKPLRDELFGLARMGHHYTTFPFEGVLSGEDQG
jgi:hypothetical protein